MNYKLGKTPVRQDPRTLRLARYMRDLPEPPDMVDWGRAVPHWGMMANDVLGDCTCAAVGHLIQTWSANALEAELTIPDDDIIALYKAVSLYSPEDPASDEGAAELDVLRFWRAHKIGGVNIAAFAAIETNKTRLVRQAIDLFGGIYVGLQLPKSCEDEELWAIPPDGPVGLGEPGSLGGHAVIVIAYDEDGLECITWGARQRMSWPFWATYCDEAYAVLSPEWIEAQGIAPCGFDFAQLQHDLAEIAK